MPQAAVLLKRTAPTRWSGCSPVDRNISRTYKKHIKINVTFPQEDPMSGLVQDVLSLVAVSSFLVVAATWIGAL